MAIKKANDNLSMPLSTHIELLKINLNQNDLNQYLKSINFDYENLNETKLSELEEKEKGILAYAWVTNFPFFEKTDEGKWTFTHNPFSMPIPEHLEWLMKGEHIEDILTTQYDLVCNGYESGGGSIRAHKPEILKATYKVMGYTEEEIQDRVGHMLEAFKFGAPPHGGIALGVERNLMNLTGEAYLREVVAFPMTRGGKTSVMNAPKPLEAKQMKELGLKVDK